MKKNILIYYFFFSILVGSLIYCAQRYQFPLPDILNFYANDFLIVPIVLIAALYFLRWSKNNPKYKLSFWVVLYVSSLYALIFEYHLPKFNLRYTSDTIDVFLYYLSGFVFYWLQKNSG